MSATAVLFERYMVSVDASKPKRLRAAPVYEKQASGVSPLIRPFKPVPSSLTTAKKRKGVDARNEFIV